MQSSLAKFMFEPQKHLDQYQSEAWSLYKMAIFTKDQLNAMPITHQLIIQEEMKRIVKK